jgi:hypothetical protein
MANPMYSPELDFAPTFRWGGREWGANDHQAFRNMLRKRGTSYEKWARRHPTAARVFDPTEQSVYGYVKPQLTAIDAERKRRQEHYKRLMGDLTGFTSALMPFLQGIAPAIGGAYGSGADTMRSAGQGYGTMLNAQNQQSADVANQVLGAIGAPEGQQVGGGDAGGVLAGVAGWIPEAMMREQGGAYADAASQLPRTAGHEANIMMKDLLRQALDEEEDFSTEVLKVMQGVPSLRNEIRDQRSQQSAAAQAFRLKQLEADRDFWLKQKALLLSQKKYKLAEKAEARLQQATDRLNYESAGRDAWGNPMPGYTVGPNGNLIPPGYKTDKNGNVVKSSTTKGSKYTPTQQASMIETIISKKEDIQADIVKAVQARKWIPSSGDRAGRAALGRQLYNQYKHLAGSYVPAQKRLKQIIRNLLAEASRLGPPNPNAPVGSAGADFWDPTP